jgi:hypothetical protein
MYDVDAEFPGAPYEFRAQWLEENLGFLKELDGQLPDTILQPNSTIFGADTQQQFLLLGRRIWYQILKIRIYESKDGQNHDHPTDASSLRLSKPVEGFQRTVPQEFEFFVGKSVHVQLPLVIVISIQGFPR